MHSLYHSEQQNVRFAIRPLKMLLGFGGTWEQELACLQKTLAPTTAISYQNDPYLRVLSHQNQILAN
jgi:hypothetical protein